tara:strand:+ start:120 stop:1877 length:1758 start_codon:yes stop_codon:yes gene_type:complete
MNLIRQSFSILDNKIKIIFFLILFASILVSFIEIVGIGILGSFVMMLSDTNGFLKLLNKYDFLNYFENLTNGQILNIFLILIPIFFISKNLILFVNLYLFNKFKVIFGYSISKKVLNRNILINYEYFLTKEKTKIIHDIKEEVVRFTGVFFSIINVLKETLLIILLLSSIIIINWKLTIIIFSIFIFFSFVLFSLLKKKLYLLGLDLTKFNSILLKNLVETFNNIKFIKIRNLENYFSNRSLKFVLRSLNTSFFQNILAALPRLLLEIFAVIGLCLLIYFFMNTSLPQERLIAIISFISLSVIRMLPSITSLNINLNNITSNLHSLEIINNYLNLKIIYPKKNLPKKKIRINSLKFKNVFFNYGDDKKNFSIKDINVELSKSDILGVLGKSGSGKTTFADLTLGLLKPSRGNIYINNNQIVEGSFENFDISYVPQSINLVDDNLRENISLGHDFDNDLMNKVISFSDLKELYKIKQDKNIGEDGSQISGGQKQRIGIARAFYSKPSLLILDEPTSELDYESENKIMKNLQKQNIDIIILIAHRLNTLNICNKLAIFNEGKILDFGLKDQVINNNKELEKYFASNN